MLNNICYVKHTLGIFYISSERTDLPPNGSVKKAASQPLFSGVKVIRLSDLIEAYFVR